MHQGYNTEQLGFKLAQEYNGTNYAVFYSHGNREKHDSPSLCHPEPFFDKFSMFTSLSIVDIVILNTGTRRVELIVEIEESQPVPKTIIGDVMNITLSDRIHIKGTDYYYSSPLLFLFAAEVKRDQKTERILKELDAINKKLGKNIELLPPILSSNVSDVIEGVEKEIKRRFPPIKK